MDYRKEIGQDDMISLKGRDHVYSSIEIKSEQKTVSSCTRVDFNLTPGAALRLDRYSMMRFRSCLHTLGRFL